MTYVCPLAQCTAAGRDRVGGKALGLGRLIDQELPVPPGFAVTIDAYRRHVVDGLLDRVETISDRARTIGDRAAAAGQIEQLILATPMPPDVEHDIRDAYAALGDDVPVAVRSSADAEDTADASFAGQQESYLWVRGADAVVEHVARCWASLFTAQALAYRGDRAVAPEHVAMGVVVQRMVPASAAGVMMTLDPVTGDPSQITIEACLGLGVGLVSGEVTPDRYAVDKVALSIRERAAGTKHVAYVFNGSCGVRPADVPPADRAQLCLDETEVIRLARLGRDLEQALAGAQDVEWALGPGVPGRRELHLVQTRPETVWSNRPRAALAVGGSSPLERMLATMRKPVRLKD